MTAPEKTVQQALTELRRAVRAQTPHVPVRRVIAAPTRSRGGKVHVQYQHPQRGWVGGCRAATDLPALPDDSATRVTCRWCANSGLTPVEWLGSS